MTLTLELSPDMEQMLAEEAQQQGMEPTDLAVTVLFSHLAALKSLQQRKEHFHQGIKQNSLQTENLVSGDAAQNIWVARLAAWEQVGRDTPERSPDAVPFQDEVDLGISRGNFYGYAEGEDDQP